MDKVATKLTIFFMEPFWVGVFEKVERGKMSVAKVTFGAQPKDYEVYDFILKNYNQLRFSQTVTVARKETPKNPKRMKRDVKKQLRSTGIGTKSQQALKSQQERMKTERKQVSREQREAEKQYLFELKQQKRKEKHRGR